MDLASLFAYVGFALVNAIVPGPNILLTLRAFFAGGQGVARAAIAGIGCGVVLWGIGASFGLARLVGSSEIAFAAMKLVGAGWVYYLGTDLVRRSIRGAPLADHSIGDGSEDGVLADPRRRFFAQGVAIAVVNPNVVLFFLAVVPRFTGEAASADVLVAMISVFLGITIGVLLVVVRVVGRFGAVTPSKAVAVGVHAVLGIWLMAFGALFLVGE